MRTLNIKICGEQQKKKKTQKTQCFQECMPLNDYAPTEERLNVNYRSYQKNNGRTP